MKIRIKEFRGVPVCKGFFPRAGLRVKPGDVYECRNESEFKACMATDLVEAAVEDREMSSRLKDRMVILDEREQTAKPKHGRPRKDAVEAG